VTCDFAKYDPFRMSLTRRQFIWSTAASAVGLTSRDWRLHAQADATGRGVFRHGVASGDPLTDRVMLWTRVTPADTLSTAAIDVDWRLGADPTLESVVARGRVRTTGERDFSVKVDAGGLQPGRTYYYSFEAGGERSPVGRTRTLPADGVTRARIALVCCSNYPAGFFNVYRCVANRPDLDAVVHVGDYIYEFENGIFGDGGGLLRIPEPRKEAVTLSDYRIRYATYRSDPDLQEVHRQHPFIAVWDDHEVTNDAWSGGAANHNPEQGEGDWAVRQAAAYRAYLEWLPVREWPGAGIHLYRSFRFGSLMDLVMLDTRGLRDRQVSSPAALADPSRSILGAAQENWLFDELRSSQRAGTAWRLLGQQVLFSRTTPPGWPALSTDSWDGYQPARDRILDFLAAERIRDVGVLSGDFHSSWALDVARDPWRQYDSATGQGSLAVEMLAPAISSSPLFVAYPERKQQAPLLRTFLPHLKFLDGDNRGYVLIDISPERIQAEWYFVPTVQERTAEEKRAAGFVCERGSSHLVPA
jgi:alkaline phosphatase D